MHRPTRFGVLLFTIIPREAAEVYLGAPCFDSDPKRYLVTLLAGHWDAPNPPSSIVQSGGGRFLDWRHVRDSFRMSQDADAMELAKTIGEALRMEVTPGDGRACAHAAQNVPCDATDAWHLCSEAREALTK